MLNLNGCKIAGGELDKLLSHDALRMLYLRRCGVPEKAIEDFEEKMASLAVYR